MCLFDSKYKGLEKKVSNLTMYIYQDVGEEGEAESDTKDITHTPNGKVQRIQWHCHVFPVTSLFFTIIVTSILN